MAALIAVTKENNKINIIIIKKKSSAFCKNKVEKTKWLFKVIVEKKNIVEKSIYNKFCHGDIENISKFIKIISIIKKKIKLKKNKCQNFIVDFCFIVLISKSITINKKSIIKAPI